MILFNGVIGNAYIRLYNPFIPLKDELKAITGIDVKNPFSNTKTENELKTRYPDNYKSCRNVPRKYRRKKNIFLILNN